MRKYFWITFILSAAFYYYLNSNRLPGVADDYYFWANLNYWLFLTPIFTYALGGYKREIYPFMGIVSFFLWLSFPLPIYFIRPDSYQLTALSIEALQWSFWGYLVYFLSYYALKNASFLQVRPFDPIRVPITNPKVRHAALFFLVLWAMYRLFAIGAIYHIATPAFYFYIGTYLLLLNKKVRISNLEKIIFVVVLLYEYATRALDGLLAPFGLLTLFIALIDYYSVRKFKRVVLLGVPFIIMYVILSPVKGQFRSEVWYSGKEYTLAQRFELIGKLRESQGLYQEDNKEKRDKDNFLWRYSYQASALSLVLRETPGNVPYWDGESYVLLSKFVPRFLWPDKPEEIMGYKFGTRYGVMSIYNKSTSMNTPLLAEAYMNYGYEGIIIIMFVLAIVYVLLNNYFNNNTISDIGKVYAIAFTFPFVVHESNFSLVFGNLPLLIITVHLILKMYVNRR